MNIAHTKFGIIEYRLTGVGAHTVLLLYGGHTNAGIRLGEEYFLERGYKILTVSRPGYGGTPLSTGRTPDSFADALAELLKQLAITKVLVIGISGGGPTAMRFAAKYWAMTDKLILQSSISFAPWPSRFIWLGSHLVFSPIFEKYTWQFIRFLLRRSPRTAIKIMIGSMTTLNPDKVVNNFSQQQLQQLVDLFAHMSSGRGFLNDIKTVSGDAREVKVPTLIIHSKYDKSVPPEHAHILAEQIKGSRLYLSEAESHLIWFSSHYPEIKNKMDEFLRS